MSEGFLRQAYINFVCCLVHVRNIHQWDGGNCDFHNVYVKRVMVRHTLRIHALAYEIECDISASRAHDMIHPILGRGPPTFLKPHM